MGDVESCAVGNGVLISPSDTVRRHVVSWTGIKSESIQLVRQQRFEYRYKASCHLLIMSERQERDDGETIVEGLPSSRLHLMNQKLTFVPAGHGFYGWQIPRTLSRYTYFYIDPHRLPAAPDWLFAKADFKPRLFFFDPALWETLQKLKAEATNSDRADQGYVEALSMVLAHELRRLYEGHAEGRQRARGGLAGWQKRRMAEYIEEHLSNQFSLSTLAKLAGLSPYHFSRAFKESFGLPPQRYQASRRIEKAKEFLAQPEISVTQIAVRLGFSDTSSFSTTFHKHTGTTPTTYRRGLE